MHIIPSSKGEITMDESEPESENCTIAHLSQDERLMLVEFAQTLHDHTTRSILAREALDRIAARLLRSANEMA